MNEPEAKTFKEFLLPSNVVSLLDVSRLASEFEQVDSELTTAATRNKNGAQKQDKPVLSDQLTDFLRVNKLELDDGRERTRLIKQLRLLKGSVPVIHMTFAVTADRASLQQLVDWLRTSVDPQSVIEVGLQPALVAGVYMRTPNHVHDFSMRALLEGKHDSLVEQLEALRGSK